MAQSIPMTHTFEEAEDADSPTDPTAEELATRVFSLVMLGVCATILFMIVMSDW